MKKKHIINLLQQIASDRGVPRNIKNSIDDLINILNDKGLNEEKIANIVFVLDDASNDPNIPPHTRTQIWNTVSFLESIKNQS